ncbi:cytochrome c oxidase subunit 4 isoform 1, mitochondrial-like [Papilio machaon]|uniref:cytochrome c oxidase subunit 4 isoform 1, mitochondrial-like n=1 Tax=Papilio machaon TaxID=76193 RepID=UPI001E664E62|nr:cytochrome c oxidase subunit 4 isoform 1, mitochondrial-like [Papilio machaon]
MSCKMSYVLLKLYKPNIYCITRSIHNRCRIGCRDVVGHGINGSAAYRDDPHFPFPSVRFKENTKDICALREKEKGDWRQLCCEEKKSLYRASFCQTFAEFQAPTGTWKFVAGWVFIVTSFAWWLAMFYHHYVYEPLPASFSKLAQKAQLRRMLELRVNPIDGISSKWDYDNDKWKVKSKRQSYPSTSPELSWIGY